MGTFVVSNLVSLQDFLVCGQTAELLPRAVGPPSPSAPHDTMPSGRMLEISFVRSQISEKITRRGSRSDFPLHNPELWQRALPADCSARHVAAALGGSFKSYRFFSPHPTLFGWRLGCSVLGLCYLLNNRLRCENRRTQYKQPPTDRVGWGLSQ